MIIFNILIVVVSTSILVFFSLYGTSRRVFLQTGLIQVLKEPKECIYAWRNAGVSGRVLFHIDRRLRAEYDPDDPILDNDNYMYTARSEAVVRKIYHIVPEESWTEVASNLSKLPNVAAAGPGFRYSLEGTPVFIMRAKDIVPMKEKVLIHINGDSWGGEGIEQIIGLLTDNVLSADFITITGKMENSHVQSFKSSMNEYL